MINHVFISFSVDQITGGPDVEYDYNNVLAVYKTMYENQENPRLRKLL